MDRRAAAQTRPPTLAPARLAAALAVAATLLASCTGSGGATPTTGSTTSTTSSAATASRTLGTVPSTPETPMSRISPPSVTVTSTIATGLTTPWGLGFLPDGTALLTERDTAKLKAIDADLGQAGHAVRTVGVVSGVVPGGEGGLLGLAVLMTLAGFPQGCLSKFPTWRRVEC